MKGVWSRKKKLKGEKKRKIEKKRSNSLNKVQITNFSFAGKFIILAFKFLFQVKWFWSLEALRNKNAGWASGLSSNLADCGNLRKL